MKNLQLKAHGDELHQAIKITGSKSESNRLLILQALFPNLKIENLSNCDDTQVLQKALDSNTKTVDIHHAGTAMRFLTAYFATQEGRTTVLTGSKRMQERPIKLLVEALKRLGAEISYEKEEGYPPLRIEGKKLEQHEVTLTANVSSQYISALMLVTPSLPKGLTINLDGKITSVPYILMTLSLLKKLGIQGKFEGQQIFIPHQSKINPITLAVESDWSSASYFYSLAALSSSASLKLSNYRKDSLQGDAILVNLYQQFGVQTTFEKNAIKLEKKPHVSIPSFFEIDLTSSPDLAQTIAVTCLGIGIGCKLTGLHTLKIKETDRLVALKNEMEKFGAEVHITENSLELKPCEILKKDESIATYNDHRMAMAFAPLALKTSLKIEDADVVSKSFPDFWEAMKKLGITSQTIL